MTPGTIAPKTLDASPRPPGAGPRPRASRRGPSLNNLAALYRTPKASTPRPSRSISGSLAIWEKALGPEHPAPVATSLNNLAAL